MKRIIGLLLLIAVQVGGGWSQVWAEGPWPEGCHTASLPSGDPRYSEDQMILTCVPPNWNHRLVVYAHGYVPAQVPLALPQEELTLPNGQTIPELLMPLGFAFATSSYHKNGYAVEQAGDDLNRLVDYLESNFGPAEKVYITGASEGGLIATMLLERRPDRYDGGLALCGPIGGAPYQMQYLGDFRVVFDYFFPSVFPFSMADVPPLAFLAWDTYVSAISMAMATSPYLTDKLFKVTRAARDPGDPSTAVETAISVLFYSVWGTNDIVDVAGGQPFGNLLTWYWGSGNDFALNRGVERVRPSRIARDYVRKFYEPTGVLQRPLVTLHTTSDGLVPFTHELIYLSRAVRNGSAHYLSVLPVVRYGHCTFTTEELLGALALLVLRTEGSIEGILNDYLGSVQDSLR